MGYSELLFIVATSFGSAHAQTVATPEVVAPPVTAPSKKKKAAKKAEEKAAEAAAATPAATTNTTTSAPAAAAAPAPMAPPEVQKILVTGSYIRQVVDQKAPSPVSVIGQGRMQETGNYTVANTLQESAVFSQGQDDPFVSMHGQTSADNLILLNGMRLAKTAGGEAVNVDFLPASVIERTDILKDGASALYGSEALSGVINMITKKDQDGGNVFIRYTRPEIGINTEETVALMYGKTFTKGYVMGALQFKNEAPGYYRDTQYGVTDLSVAGSNYSAPGNIVDETTGDVFRDPSCPADRISRFSGLCRQDNYQFAQINGGQAKQYYSSFLSAGYKSSKALNFDFLSVLTRRSWKAEGSPTPFDFRDDSATGGQNFAIPKATTDAWNKVDADGNPGNLAGPGDLYFSPRDFLGTTKTSRDVDNFIHQGRVSGEVAKWDYDLSLSHNLTTFTDTTTSGQAVKQKVFDAMVAGTFNPFAPLSATNNLNGAEYQTWFKHTSELMDARLVFSGEAFNLFNRPVNLAVGTEGQWTNFKMNNDPLSLASGALIGGAANQHGSRNVSSGFMELVHSPIKDLDLQIAGRFDNYSDVGSTINPKIGFAYHLSPKVTFRSTYGSGFKAPDLLSVFQGTSSTISNFRDEVTCQAQPTGPTTGENDQFCKGGYYTVTTGGNRNLQAELATQVNAGFVFTPEKDLSVIIDHWVVNGERSLTDVSPYALTRIEQMLGPVNGPAYIQGLGIDLRRDASGHITSLTTPTKINAGIFIIRGLDITVQKKTMVNPFHLGSTSLIFTSEHSHVLSSGGYSLPIDPYRRQYDLNWKNNTSLTLSRGNHMYKVGARTFNGGDKSGGANGVGGGSTYAYTEFDFHYEYFAPWQANISFGIKNFTNETPIGDANGLKMPANANGYYLGRTFYAGYNQDF